MFDMLSTINSPADLKRLGASDLPQLATEMREYMVDVVSKTGGHLAPSLGVIELSIAIHYIFNTPEDKIIWDVSHQSYAHKILTGRREAFKNLRQIGGISGFTKREESPHDTFGTGHASTSISAALGIAKSFKKRGSNNRVIAVIGDGAMTGGLAFEGLNQGGYHKTGNLIVILNDNEMSISKNVGALSKFFSMRIHGKRAARIRRWFKRILMKFMPRRGKLLWQIARRAEEVTASFLTPGFMFEAFGYHYIGPLNGHNLDELIHVFKEVNDIPIGDRPILIHVLTKKGCGYKPAEDNPEKFHGIGPFDKKSGKTPHSNKISYTEMAGKTILELGKKDKNIISVTAAMPTGTGMDIVARELPDQFYDVGIAEGHAVTFAAGLATEGYKPVVAIYSTFLQRAYDHILHDVCLQNLPVTFAIDRAGLVGEDGPTHHGVFDLSFLRQIPNMVVMAPRDENELQHMLFTAVYSGLPCAVRYPRGGGEGVTIDKQFKNIPIGKAEIIFAPNTPNTINSIDTADVLLLATGNRAWPAVKAAKALGREGISVCVVDARFVKPLDEELLTDLAGQVKKWVTVEENVIIGGFGAAVSEFLTKTKNFDVELKMLGLPDKFIEHGPQNILRGRYGIDTDGIIKGVKELWTSERKSAGLDANLNKKDLLQQPTATSASK